MEDLIFKLWPYFEKAGLVAGVIMSVWLYFSRRDLADMRASYNELLDKYDAVQEQRIKDGKVAYEVIDKNTKESATMIELVRALLPGRGR